MKKFCSIIIIVSIIISMIVVVSADAMTADELLHKLQALKLQYPNGTHQTKFYNSIYPHDGTACYKDLSQHFSWECMAWARKVYDSLWGASVSNGEFHSNTSNLCVGDYVRYNAGSLDHSILVTNIVNNTVYYTDCNLKLDGKIQWDRQTTITDLQIMVNKKLNYSTSGRSYGHIVHYPDNNIKELTTSPTYQISFDANGGTLDSGYKTAYYTDLVNVARGPDCMVICNNGSTTGHNMYGVEAIVDSNYKVTNIIDGVGNSSIPNGGFVISGNGKARQWILDNIEIGDFAFYNEGITKLTVWDKNQWLTRGISVQSNSTYGDLPVPLSREGYVFDGWYTAVSGGTKIISSSKFTANTNQTLYAHWSIPEYYITFDGNGGETDTADKAGYYTDLVNTTRGANSMVVFDGGGTTTGTNEYGSEVLVDSNHRVVSIEYRKGNATVPSGGVVVSGHGTAAAWINSNVEVGDWLFYNSNIDKIILRSENTFLTLSKMVSPGNPYGKLPIPKNREGYIFKGWYTEANEGTQITSDTIVTINADQTLYAKWAQPLIVESYTYSVDEKKLDVTVNVDESLEEQKGYVIIALYNGDRMIGVHREEANVLVSHTFEKLLPAYKYELKVFCWSDFETMTPLCTALTEMIQ